MPNISFGSTGQEAFIPNCAFLAIRRANIDGKRIAFSGDLPFIENIQNCDLTTGTNCTLIPRTDDGKPAAFYPFFSMGSKNGECVWSFGNDQPGFTTNDFGKNAQYGSLISLPFLDFGGGGSISNLLGAYTGFHSNPCPSAEGGDTAQTA